MDFLRSPALDSPTSTPDPLDPALVPLPNPGPSRGPWTPCRDSGSLHSDPECYIQALDIHPSPGSSLTILDPSPSPWIVRDPESPLPALDPFGPPHPRVRPAPGPPPVPWVYSAPSLQIRLAPSLDPPRPSPDAVCALRGRISRVQVAGGTARRDALRPL